MIQLMLGDCLERMKEIPDQSVDMVLADVPYGTTACKWDSVIPFEPMWAELKRIAKDNAAICLFGSEPFSSNLRMSNIKMYRYDWIWHKQRPTGFAIAKKQPMRSHENISVFYRSQPLYSPIKEPRDRKPQYADKLDYGTLRINTANEVQGIARISAGKVDLLRFPTSVQKFDAPNNSHREKFHPTQKPVPLLEYMIKTYTNEGETVLDFTMGSGSTGVAAKNLGRSFIGIERELQYFEIAQKRIESAGVVIEEKEDEAQMEFGA